jgi:hypothetical protein
MLGRRSYPRLSIGSGAEGVLSLARDIAVRVDDRERLIAVSCEAGVIGETVRVEVPDDGMDVIAQIVESKPFVIDGAVRHRLQLRRVHTEDSTAHDGGDR